MPIITTTKIFIHVNEDAFSNEQAKRVGLHLHDTVNETHVFLTLAEWRKSIEKQRYLVLGYNVPTELHQIDF